VKARRQRAVTRFDKLQCQISMKLDFVVTRLAGIGEAGDVYTISSIANLVPWRMIFAVRLDADGIL
jgi:hypothetical protein